MASFAQHVDSVDLHGHLVAVGLSALEGDSWDGGLQTLNVENGEKVSRTVCETGVAMVRFTGTEGNLIACACDDGAVRCYGSRELDLRATILAHDDMLAAAKPSLSTTNQLLTCSWDGSIKDWDLDHLCNNDTKEHTPLFAISSAHAGAVTDVAHSPFSPSIFASSGMDGFLRLWDKRSSLTHGALALLPHDQAVSCVEFHPVVDHILFTGTDAGEVYTFDLRNLKSLNTLNSSSINVNSLGNSETSRQRHAVHSARVRRICPIPNHREFVLSASDDCTVALSSIAIGDSSIGLVRDVEARFKPHEDYITDMAIHSADGDELCFLTASTDKTVKLNDFKWKMH